MESLESLKSRKRDLEAELSKITIKKRGSTPWGPGVQDQYKSDSFGYEEYTDTSKAYRLKDEIKELNHQIETYALRARRAREAQEELEESRRNKYSYTSDSKEQKTDNPAIAARYNAQQRFFAMSKLKQTMLIVTGQKKKFEKLWLKAVTTNKKTQEKVASELNGMFR